jgi:hypothetical protein
MIIRLTVDSIEYVSCVRYITELERIEGVATTVNKREWKLLSLEYLQAVMHEALRIHPAVGMSLSRFTPRGGIEINGHFVPEGVK